MVYSARERYSAAAVRVRAVSSVSSRMGYGGEAVWLEDRGSAGVALVADAAVRPGTGQYRSYRVGAGGGSAGQVGVLPVTGVVLRAVRRYGRRIEDWPGISYSGVGPVPGCGAVVRCRCAVLVCGASVQRRCAVPMCGAGVWFRCAVPVCSVGVRCWCAVPVCDVGVRCWCAVPVCGASVRCRYAVPVCGAGARCRYAVVITGGSHIVIRAR
jgi:hypothetical protein